MYCVKNKSKFRKLDILPVLKSSLAPCPMKDTNHNATSTDNEAGVPALENSIPKVDNIKETGKVTAVVAVMQVNTNPIKDRKTGKKQVSKTVLMTKSSSSSAKKRPKLKTKLIRVLLDSGSTRARGDDLIFIKKGLRPNILLGRKRVVHESGPLPMAPLQQVRWV